MSGTDTDRANSGDRASEFEAFLKRRVDGIFSQPFFTTLSGGLTAKQWEVYAKQFYVTCDGFDRLLEATLKLAQQAGSADLTRALEDNLADERGQTETSAVSHKVLRADFFTAIGLPESELSMASTSTHPIFPATEEHRAIIEKMIGEGNLETLLGAFAAQEYLANGPGFKILRNGIIASFPHLADPEHQSMRYLFEHIDCDGEKHFPELLHAMAPLMADPASRSKMYQGAASMLDAEAKLFASFEHNLLGDGDTPTGALKVQEAENEGALEPPAVEKPTRKRPR